MVSISHNIRKLREIKNYSQDYISKKLGLSVRAYSKIENGESKLSVGRLIEIATILDVKPEDILNFDEKIIIDSIRNSETALSKRILKDTNSYEKYIKHLEDEISFLREKISGR